MSFSTTASTAKGMSPTLQNHYKRLTSNANELLLLDGGTGEELFRRNVPDDRKIWSATAVVNSQYHSVLKEVHTSFLKAGSDVITTNSYGITPGVGFSLEDVQKYVDVAGRLARECIPSEEQCDAESKLARSGPMVFGSLGPLVESYRPDKILPRQEGVGVYTIMTKALSAHVDCFLAETMSSFHESSQAVEAVGKLSDEYKRPMMVSYTLKSDGCVRSGEDVCDAIQKLVGFAANQNVPLLGVMFNCAEPEAITIAFQQIHFNTTIRQLLKEKGILLGAYANRLTPIASDWSLEESEEAQEIRKDVSPQQYFDEFVNIWVRDLGVQMVGGCCGITPEHIAYMHSHLFTE